MITDTRFKFHHQDSPSTIYTYHPIGCITWWLKSGELETLSIDYSRGVVEKYIKDGIWVVLEEGTLQSFTATQMGSLGDGSVDVCAFNGSMAVCAEEGPVIITKEQAMEFFGLQEKVDD